MSDIGKIVINEGKEYKINTSFGDWGRHAIKTDFIKVGSDYYHLIDQYVNKQAYGNDMLAISSRIISMCQCRVIDRNFIKISILAKFLYWILSRFDNKFNTNPYKIQYAINKYGRWKIFKSTFIYTMGGNKIDGIDDIDGFDEDRFYEYRHIGTLLPQNPNAICNTIYDITGLRCVILKVDDQSCNVIGKSNSLKLDDDKIKEIFRDNPFGQSDECTPFILFRKLYENMITLERFLMLFAGDPAQASTFSLINTNNSSFPKRYRYKHEHPASLWRRLWEKRDPILRRYVQRIIVMPENTDIEKLSDNANQYDLYIDIDKGSYFCTSTGKTVLPVIHIILDNEESIV